MPFSSPYWVYDVISSPRYDVMRTLECIATRLTASLRVKCNEDLGCFLISAASFFSLGKLSCTMLFKGFVATFCQSLRTFCITTRTRRNDIFGVEFLGSNLSLSVHRISSPYKWLSCRCSHIYSSKPTFHCLEPNESSHRSCMQLCVSHCALQPPVTQVYQNLTLSVSH